MRIITVQLAVNDFVDIIELSEVIKFFHKSVASLNLPAVPVLNNISLSDNPLLFHLPTGLCHTDLSASTLADANTFLNRLSESLV
jgi:hypothetical protein